jgi:uncharacterized protein YndB with AHSA1/START domain
MTARISSFDPRVGGGYHMTLVYADPSGANPKSTENSDVLRGRFLELSPDDRIIETIEFESDDPSFQGLMTFPTTMSLVIDGTKVTVVAENVPSGISEADYQAGMTLSFKNLATLLE